MSLHTSAPPSPSRARHLVARLSPPDDTPLDQHLAQIVNRNRAKAADQKVKAPPLVVQDYRPLVDCLESELAAIYWSTVGIQAFAGNEVPFLINNDGQLSQDVAAVFHANCVESAPTEQAIRILEVGAGTGLFALYFLESFRAICRTKGTDFYQRLTYYVSDGSRRTVEQWQACEQFADHGEHAILGTCDARCPGSVQTLDGRSIEIAGLRAVFANYILDVLPAAVIRYRDGCVEQLCVRTLIDDEAELRRLHPEFDANEIVRLAASRERNDRARLLPVINMFRFETSFVPLGEQRLPYVDTALAFSRDVPRMLLNFGALDCLQECCERIVEDGFVLFNDYGPSREDEIAKYGTATRFGSSIAMGVNFPLIEHCFSGRTRVFAPPNDAKRSIHSRLLLKKPMEATWATYNSEFGRNRWYWEEDATAVAQARKAAMAGRPDEAMGHFAQALAETPGNWSVMGEVAEFLTRTGQTADAVYLAGLAVRRNPWYSSWVWNVLGDALFAAERVSDAHSAYEQAASVNPTDVTANFNLSFTHARAGRFREALDCLSRALSHDYAGDFRERIITQQQQIMHSISARWVAEQLRRHERAAVFE